MPQASKKHKFRTEPEVAQHLAAIVESSEDAIIGKTIEGIVQTWNLGAVRLYGYTAEEMIGQSMERLFPPDRLDEETRILARLVQGESVRDYEAARVRKDGKLISVSLTILPIRNKAGVVIGASHIARDVTGRTETGSTAAQLAAIVESSEDAIISKSLDGIVETWNEGAEGIYGYRAAEMIGRPMSVLLPPDRMDEENAILERLKRGERVSHFETVRHRKDGQKIDVSLAISPMRDRDGKVCGASHVARDITDKKVFEAKLTQTQKLESLGVLAGGVAHDFNNLLTGILGNASLAAEATHPSSPTQRYLGECVKAAERAAQLTRQLLAYAGKGRFVIEPINLSELVREISNLVQTSIPRKVQVRLELHDDIPAIEADAGQLQQVVMNLVINAAEAIGDNVGMVVVTTDVQDVDTQYIRSIWGNLELKPGKHVVLEVHDSGCGMDQATIERIFDPFFTTKFTGRGLGLAAVSGIMRGHKGAMKVYSAPGKGTTFKLLFPVAQSVAPVEPRIAQPMDLAGRGLILVVDDEETVRETVRNTLEMYGYQVMLAEDGREAVELFRGAADRVRLVLLDLTMPKMDGEEVLRELQLIRPRVRVVLSSGFNEVEAVRRFTGKGLAGFIQKPYTAVALAQRVKMALSKN